MYTSAACEEVVVWLARAIEKAPDALRRVRNRPALREAAAVTFGSCFAGVGGFDLGFERSGMVCKWQVEIDRDAQRVLAHHWPGVPRHDDVREVGRRNLPRVDVLCGGFPCQDLSVAGRRAGLGGERSGLFWELVRITDEIRPRFLVWENVPGLLSSVTAVNPPPVHPADVDAAGRITGESAPEWLLDEDYCFEAVLCGLRDIGYFGAWRHLDTQFFGAPQRRRRVFGVFARGRAGAERAAEILALAHGSARHLATGGETRQGAAATLRGRSHGAGVNPPGRGGEDDSNLIVLNGHHPRNEPDDPLVCGSVSSKWAKGSGGPAGDECYNLIAPCLRFNVHNNSDAGMESRMLVSTDVAFTLKSAHRGIDNGWQGNYPASATGVRRLMPVECLRLQSFPDDWLDLDPELSDSAKYRLIGNAVTVNVAEWLGRRMSA